MIQATVHLLAGDGIVVPLWSLLAAPGMQVRTEYEDRISTREGCNQLRVMGVVNGCEQA
ncbi:MAG: hypothetical protein ACR2HR_09500 [Euzebya sp.]